jgi:hypothetical protein
MLFHQFGNIFGLDEHVDNDVTAVEEMLRVCKDRLMITVPSHRTNEVLFKAGI